MKTVTVQRLIRAPIEKVFAELSDHANYAQFPGIKAARLLEPGPADPNGNGALREVDAGFLWVQEEIFDYDPPNCFSYRILHSRPPLQHEGGTLSLVTVAGGTEVTWSSTLRFPIPLIGDWITALASPKIGRAFAAMLKYLDQKLAA